MASSGRCKGVPLFLLLYLMTVVGVVGGALAGYALTLATFGAMHGTGGIIIMALTGPLLLAVSVTLGTLIGGLSAGLLGALLVRRAAERDRRVR